MLEHLFPEAVVVVTGDGAGPTAPLYPEEEAAIRRAVEKRRRDFTIGRTCAREALRRLGAPVGALPVGADRAPRWPRGVVGSITHCEGLVAAAVAWRRDFGGIGLDAEVAAPLEGRLVRLICTDAEQEWIARNPPPSGTDWAKVTFSAKESVHKAVAPGTGITLGFHDVEIDFHPHLGRFSVRQTGSEDARLPDLRLARGRFVVGNDVVATAVRLPPTVP